MCDNMRKHHLCLGLGLLLAVCAAPTRAHAKPQATPERAATPAVTSQSPDAAKERGAPRAKTRAKKREAPPCLAKPVVFVRELGSELETRSLALTYCDGKPNPAALEALSVLARSRHVERPESVDIRAYQKLAVDRGPASRRRDPAYLTAHVMRLHEGLLERLQKVADRFPGKTIEVVSGHRPEARLTSRHHHGRALDFRLSGVTRERLRDFLRGFDATGVGYYPNSTFVHMDVRDDKGYWVDRSGPGEAADYGTWPPPRREVQATGERILREARADLARLGEPIEARGARADDGLGASRLRPSAPAPRQRSLESAQRLLSAALGASLPRAEPRAVANEDAEPGDHLSDTEIAKIRAEALNALQELR
jgi:Bacterial protein of unknown function (DUF882)